MLEIEENGTKFAEGIEIDEQRNVAVFRVPAHMTSWELISTTIFRW